MRGSKRKLQKTYHKRVQKSERSSSKRPPNDCRSDLELDKGGRDGYAETETTPAVLVMGESSDWSSRECNPFRESPELFCVARCVQFNGRSFIRRAWLFSMCAAKQPNSPRCRVDDKADPIPHRRGGFSIWTLQVTTCMEESRPKQTERAGFEAKDLTTIKGVG